MSKLSKSQWDFGELFPTEAALAGRCTPTGCRLSAQGWRSAAQPTLGVAHNIGVPCRGTGSHQSSARLFRPFRAGNLFEAVSQGSAARNPGLYSIAPLGQRACTRLTSVPPGQWAVAPLISTRLQPGVSGARCRKPFQRFADGRGAVPNAKAVETAPACARPNTGLKPVANERSKQSLPVLFFAPSAPFCG